MVPAVGKAGFSFGPCDKEVAPLLPGSHDLCVN